MALQTTQHNENTSQPIQTHEQAKQRNEKKERGKLTGSRRIVSGISLTPGTGFPSLIHLINSANLSGYAGPAPPPSASLAALSM